MMHQTTDTDRSYGFTFSDAEFETIARLAHSKFGLHTPPEKKRLTYSRLTHRLRALSMTSFAQYCAFITSPDGQNEHDSLLSALTTNVSHFFREPHHFDILLKKTLPPLIEHARQGGRVRLWSAGCAAGQEPYSIAFCILKLCPEAPNLDIKILATDIDTDILETAKLGRYDNVEIGPIQQDYRGCLDINHDTFQIQDDAKKLIAFTQLNLVAAWPETATFDVIFCRNVAIYFDRNTQNQLLLKLNQRLGANSYLFIGHSERLSTDLIAQFDHIGITAFLKKNDTAVAECALKVGS